MKLYEFYHAFHEELQDVYPSKGERESLFFLLVADVLKREKTSIRLQLTDQERLDESACEKLEKGLMALKDNKPIQYILGHAHFFGLDWIVDKRALIPRPETEELISWVIEDFASKRPLRLLDVGAGSGCIAISLKNQWPDAEVHALDVSQKALEIARQNAERHRAEIFFHQLDILRDPPLSTRPSFDVIVSNPPYVRQSEKALTHPNVYRYEPAEALFVSDEDPLIFYRKIAAWAKQKLTAHGAIYFEVNQFLSTETALLIKSLGYADVETRKDIHGHPRMIKASMNVKNL